MHSLTVCLLDMTLVSFPNPQQDHPGNQTNIAYGKEYTIILLHLSNKMLTK